MISLFLNHVLVEKTLDRLTNLWNINICMCNNIKIGDKFSKLVNKSGSTIYTYYNVEVLSMGSGFIDIISTTFEIKLATQVDFNIVLATYNRWFKAVVSYPDKYMVKIHEKCTSTIDAQSSHFIK